MLFRVDLGANNAKRPLFIVRMSTGNAVTDFPYLVLFFIPGTDFTNFGTSSQSNSLQLTTVTIFGTFYV